MSTNTETDIRNAISHPAFSHSRAGEGFLRDWRGIYHFDPASPSGVKLVLGDDAERIEPLLRELRHTSPLSPTERY